jgi:hypothetical protein
MRRVTITSAYRPYDKLMLREKVGRSIWTVLDCKKSGSKWQVMAIRCLPGCTVHRKRR